MRALGGEHGAAGTPRNALDDICTIQKRVAKRLGIGQEGISKLEQRTDLLISTLRNCVEAMGGSLSLVAAFPDRKPVVLSGLGTIASKAAAGSRKPAAAHLEELEVRSCLFA